MKPNPIGYKILTSVVILATLLSGCASLTITPDAATSPNSAPVSAPNVAPTADLASTEAAVGTRVAQAFYADLTQTVPVAATPVPATATQAPTATSTPLPPPAIAPAAVTAATATPYRTPTLTTFNCTHLYVSPKLLSDRVKAGSNFVATWIVANTGTETWSDTDVDLKWIAGRKLQTRTDSMDLDHTVYATGTLTVNIDMKAPDLPGVYYSTWVMTYGSLNFCTLNMAITVVK